MNCFVLSRQDKDKPTPEVCRSTKRINYIKKKSGKLAWIESHGLGTMIFPTKSASVSKENITHTVKASCWPFRGCKMLQSQMFLVLAPIPKLLMPPPYRDIPKYYNVGQTIFYYLSGWQLWIEEERLSMASCYYFILLPHQTAVVQPFTREDAPPLLTIIFTCVIILFINTFPMRAFNPPKFFA